MEEPERYEPQPRWGHVSVTIGDKLYMWGGRIENFSGSSKKELASCVEVFDFTTEKWEKKTTTGVPPSGLYNNAYTTIGRSLYVYGGWDGQIAHNTLHELNVDTLHWTQIMLSDNQQSSKATLKLSGCGLVAYGLKKLVLFGGYGLVTDEKKKKKKKKKKKSMTVSFSQSISEEDEANVTIVSESSDKPGDSVSGVGGDSVIGVSGDGSIGTSNSQATQNGESEVGATSEPGDKSDGGTSEADEKSEVGATSEPGDKSDGGTSEADEKSEVGATSEPGDKSDGGMSEADEKSEVGATSEPGDKSDGGMSEADEKSEVGATSEPGDKSDSVATSEADGFKSEPGDKSEGGDACDKSKGVSNGEAVNGSVNGEAETTQNDPNSIEVSTQIKTSSSMLNAVMDIMKVSQEEETVAHNGVDLDTVMEKPSVSSDAGEDGKSGVMNGDTGSAGVDSEKVNGHTGDDGSVASGAIDGSDKAAKADDDVFTEEASDKEVIQVEKWTNEVKVFDIETGEWSTPEVSGDQPPPCVDFSFLSIDNHRAVVFGGFQPDKGAVSETYVLDMASWRWTKLGRNGNGNGKSWPKGRDGHASCVLCTGTCPQVLISGGWDANNILISDVWVLDVNSGSWKELTVPGVIGNRLWHTVVSFSVSSKIKQLLFFGGCPGLPLDLSTLESWSKLAATMLTELGMVDPVTHSGDLRLDDPPFTDNRRSEWAVFDALSFEQLGEPTKRMRERVALAEYRAIRAEKIARQVLKKVENLSIRRSVSPFSIALASPTGMLSSTTTVGAGGESNLPFWVIPRTDVRITGREIGKGRWTSVHVANYRGDHMAARCLFSQIISEENQKLFIECMNLAATLRHSNLLPFIGAILEEEPIIITELMPFNLKMVMDKGPLLNHQIIGIALDVAKALNFLHQTKPEPVSHGELTNTSVLLEQAKGNRWRAKLYDYMTAKFFKQIIAPTVDSDREQSPGVFSVSSLRSSNQSPSVDSEVLIPGSRANMMGRKASVVVQDSDPFILTPSKDVYYYGLLLTEMCTGSLPLEVSLTFLIESITWTEVANIIRACIGPVPDKRPTMKDIVSKVTAIHNNVSLSGAPLSRSGARPT